MLCRGTIVVFGAKFTFVCKGKNRLLLFTVLENRIFLQKIALCFEDGFLYESTTCSHMSVAEMVAAFCFYRYKNILFILVYLVYTSGHACFICKLFKFWVFLHRRFEYEIVCKLYSWNEMWDSVLAWTHLFLCLIAFSLCFMKCHIIMFLSFTCTHSVAADMHLHTAVYCGLN